MQVLISPVDADEAALAADGGADLVDVKNPAEGSLGAGFPWRIREVAARVGGRAVISATLGDLPFKPGTAALAALGALHSGARYVKAGLHGPRDVAEGRELMAAVVRTCREFDAAVTVVAAGYADFRRFDGLAPAQLVEIAAASGCDVVMLDTLVKDGRGLFDALSEAELARFADAAHAHGLKVALAGSVRADHLPLLARLGADVVGARGAVCRGGDRGARVEADAVRAFVAAARLQRA